MAPRQLARRLPESVATPSVYREGVEAGGQRMLFYQGLSGVCRKALAPFLGGKGAARPLTYPEGPSNRSFLPLSLKGGFYPNF